MVSILVKIVVIVVSAIAGGFFGAWFSYDSKAENSSRYVV